MGARGPTMRRGSGSGGAGWQVFCDGATIATTAWIAGSGASCRGEYCGASRCSGRWMCRNRMRSTCRWTMRHGRRWTRRCISFQKMRWSETFTRGRVRLADVTTRDPERCSTWNIGAVDGLRETRKRGSDLDTQSPCFPRGGPGKRLDPALPERLLQVTALHEVTTGSESTQPQAFHRSSPILHRRTGIAAEADCR